MTGPQRRLAAFAIIVGLLLAALLATTPTASGDEPPPNAACAVDPDGQPVHCRCLHTVPQGLPVDDPADCPPELVPTTTSVYVPTPADLNDVPVEPQLVEPAFTG